MDTDKPGFWQEPGLYSPQIPLDSTLERTNQDTALTKDKAAPLDFSRISRVSVKTQALEQIKQYIASSGTQPGQRLPSERELAEWLGIGRPSVREALKVLEGIGLVESRIGDGTFITDNVGASIGRTIGLSLMTWGGTIVELLEARGMIETEAARAAAEQATAAEQSALAAELTRMAQAATFFDYLEADMRFHRLVAEATHNSVMARIVANLVDLLEAVLREANTDALAMTAEGNGTHYEVLAAIQRRNPDAAAKAMRSHLRFATELWQAVISLSTAGQATEPPLSGARAKRRSDDTMTR